MPAATTPPDLADSLERAYRLALGIEAAARNRLPAEASPEFSELAQWLFASELLCVLDEARASLIARAPCSEDGGQPPG